MSIVELYNLTLLHEALSKGEKVLTSDITLIYNTIPNVPFINSRKSMVKIINEYFDKVSTESIQRYLVDKQLKNAES